MVSPSHRPWREAVGALHLAGWEPRDIAAAVCVSPGTVYRMLGIRPWEQPSMPPVASCAQRVGEFWCDAPVRPGQVFCDEHWRLTWPQ